MWKCCWTQSKRTFSNVHVKNMLENNKSDKNPISHLLSFTDMSWPHASSTKRWLRDYGIVTNYEQSDWTKNNNSNHSVIGFPRSLLPRDLSVKENSYFAADHRLHLLTPTHVTFNKHEALNYIPLLSCVHDIYHSCFCWRFCLKLNCIPYN